MEADPGEDYGAIDDDQLLGIVQREQDSSLGWWNTYLSESRRATLAEYLGNQRGDEREGRSQVVTRDTFEQVEALMPQLMEIFTSSNEVVSFEPQNEEDVEMAEQITDTVNYVFRSNDGFMVLYTMFKDALIQKNGIVKVWWEESAEAHYASYEGKSYPEYLDLDKDPAFTVTGLTAVTPEGEEITQDDIGRLTEAVEAGALGAEWLTGLRFDVEGKHVDSSGHIVLDNIPCEEFLVNRDCRGLHDKTCRFTGHRIRTTASQLIAWGIDEDLVESIPTSHGVFVADQDAIVRASKDDANPLNVATRQDAERQLYVIEAYIKVDRDGDGISEWCRVLAGGDYAQVLLEVEPVDGHPFASVTPIPVPHRFFGLGLADVVADLQNLNTTLWRQYLDSLYLATNPRKQVLAEGGEEEMRPLADIDAMLDQRVGGWYAVFAPDAVRIEETKDVAQHVLPAFEVHEKMKQNRTGISPDAMGINPDAISKHVFGAMVQTSASAQRIMLYARVFAETGVPQIFRLIYKLLASKHTEQMIIRLRGKYVPVSPTEWKTGFDCSVSVGLGHGSRMERAANAEAIGAMQEKLLTAGFNNMITQDHIYNTAREIIQARGYKDVGSYVADPSTTGPPDPPQPDAAEIAVKSQSEVEYMKIELERQKLQLDAKKAELQHEREMAKMGLDKAKLDQDWQLKLNQNQNQSAN